ncbi:hypothetical protein AB0C06_30300 [Micromonospora inaquosa]|uniref:magnesium transporter MgtE N-terminal domain-containing protein n=1 Tax=Micromonospora inaquosa TaxID=2203716 RepID=UPI0033DDFB14
MSEAPGIEAPNPASVMTVADLARELRVLRIYCGRPSVRDIAERADQHAFKSLPRSTAHDVLSGKRGLPRMSALMALLRALGEENTGPWQDAWRRAELHKQGLLDRLVTSVTQPTGPKSAAAGSTRIRVVNVQRGAALVEALPVEDVVGQLVDMPASDAARRLDAVTAVRAVEVLTEMDDKVAGDILGEMQRTTAAAALTTMPPPAAAELLLRIKHDHRTGIFSQLPAEAAPVIFAEMSDWITVLSQSGVAPNKAVQFLANMPIEDAVAFFSREAAAAPRWLAVAPPTLAGRVVTAVKPEQAAAWLNNIPGTAFAAIVDDRHPATIRPILPHLRQAAVRVHQALGEQRLTRLLEGVSPEEAQGWLLQLRGRLSSEAFTQIRRAVHKRP